MIALRKFHGTVDGKEKTFYVGDQIDAKTVKELGLADKPELAKESKAKKTQEQTSIVGWVVGIPAPHKTDKGDTDA